MKYRTIPFGYMYVNGAIVIDKEESAIVKNIFSEYLNGKILRVIAEELTKAGVMYMPEKTIWKKIDIFHILENKRYVGGDGYPPIITEELFNRVNDKRDQKNHKKLTQKHEVECLKNKIICGECGYPMRRNNHSDWKERWKCSNGCNMVKRLNDDELSACVKAIFQRIIDIPVLIDVVPVNKPYRASIQAVNLSNEISRMQDKGDFNFDVAKKLIAQLANTKFKQCAEDKSIYTGLVRQRIKDLDRGDGIELCDIKDIINSIIINSFGDVSVELINGAIIKTKEEENEGN